MSRAIDMHCVAHVHRLRDPGIVATRVCDIANAPVSVSLRESEGRSS
jgi:hypothetical protein